MIPEVTRDAALQVFARRFEGAGMSNQEIGERFDQLLAGGFIDVTFDPDGELRVHLCGRRSRQ